MANGAQIDTLLIHRFIHWITYYDIVYPFFQARPPTLVITVVVLSSETFKQWVYVPNLLTWV